jgi:hypothetical protein
MKKDLTIFIKIASYGSFFIISLILFIIGVGIYSTTNTNFEVLLTHTADNNFYSNSDPRYLYLINTDFSKLAGMLGIGYFLHTVSIPIIKNNKNPENNIRDITIGYSLVCMTYVLVGTLGYIGFSGFYFNSHFQDESTSAKSIDQDCI